MQVTMQHPHLSPSARQERQAKERRSSPWSSHRGVELLELDVDTLKKPARGFDLHLLSADEQKR